MEKEKELHEGEWWNTCPYRNERPGCRHCEITRNIVEEATRRGIQQGKREAWEEAEQMTHDVAGRNDSNGRYNACEEMREEIIAKLSSLDNSSKE